MLEALFRAGLHLKAEKCEFHKQEVKYLGPLVGKKWMKMDTDKVATVKDWEPLECTFEVRSFVGFANFYQMFIKGFSNIVRPLTVLKGKEIKFSWLDKCQQAFKRLKRMFTTTSILAHFHWDKKIQVETDASDLTSAVVLSQYDNDGILRPVTFYWKEHSSAEVNYEMYDKELMAFVWAIKEWRAELLSAEYLILVFSDHQNLKYFMSNENISRRQARWAEFLSRFNFELTYRPGKAGGKPDALT